MQKPLWRCPACGRLFANRNQTHTCAPPRPLEEHFAGRSPNVIETYRAFEATARANGPLVVVPEKTRIAFQVRMSFAAVTLRRRWVDAHVVLARRLENARFRRIQSFCPVTTSTSSGSKTRQRSTMRWRYGWPRRTASAGRST
jgi:Domain of unknown function (DUF5655)